MPGRGRWQSRVAPDEAGDVTIARRYSENQNQNNVRKGMPQRT
jgi:hypothetical protein